MSELEKSRLLPTSARISLGQTGPSIPTREQLRFQLDHALARDAVHAQLDVTTILRRLEQRGLSAIALQSAASDRRTYLRRPDLGRRLHGDFARILEHHTYDAAQPPDVVFILADGLSALAVERHALPLLDATLPLISNPCSLIPLVQNARVAIGDEIGERLHAKLTVMLIGERPGLSSPDSLGVYITWEPRVGRSDAERNCISNIRAEGLSYVDAAARIVYYIHESQRLRTSGVALKDPALPLLSAGQ
jgi:ethanolamine ammonia-lyase small subunit